MRIKIMESNAEMAAVENNAVAMSNIANNIDWNDSDTPAPVTSNSTLLFIAVEYVKDTSEYKFESNASLQQGSSYVDYNEHVSPLDPNMSSAARYSPVYVEGSSSQSNPVIVQQVLPNSAEQALPDMYINNLPNPQTPLEALPASLSTSDNNILRQVVSNRYMQIEEANATSGALQIVPDGQQEVELLITDQATGISYSVSTQEYLVEKCLADEQHLLEALSPGPLLDSDLLSLDESTLKTHLNDIVQPLNGSVSIDPAGRVKQEVPELSYELEESLRRSERQNDCQSNGDEQLFSRVHSIPDKPVLSRARATLPASYLQIIKINDEYGVFARRMIPKRTQFGPLEGDLVPLNNIKVEDNRVEHLVENEDCSVSNLDISDENTANWMCFVRRACAYSEQNLVLNQQGPFLYYTTTRNILPRQELLVGYSISYASRHNLPYLKPPFEEANSWPCFECSSRFPSSEELQQHLNVHDNQKDENTKPRKKLPRNKRKIILKKYQKMETLVCNYCKVRFNYPRYHILIRHLQQHGFEPGSTYRDKYTTIRNWHCEDCGMSFDSEALLKVHSHKHITSDTVSNVSTCPACSSEFSDKLELASHVAEHANKGFKCPACYKVFASRDRIQRHMLVHGSEESKPLKCDTCNKRFLNNSALACHLKTHSVGRKVYECPICKQSFHHVLQLKTHVPQHCEDGQYTCPHCDKLFREYSVIRKHIRAFHCELKHDCPHCAKPFPTLDKLRMHLLRHSDHREFLCADCGKQFKRKDKLKEHSKRMHSEERENAVLKPPRAVVQSSKKFTPRVQPTDYHRFIYKCHTCLVGFKRRGMLVNHLAKRHPDISPESVPELNLPILRTTRDYYCQYCDKVYKSSSKRKAHILKNHPGAALPMSNRRQSPEMAGLPNPSFSQTVGSVTTHPHSCQWCHKQYASKAKLLQHQRKKHTDLLPVTEVRSGQKCDMTGDMHYFKKELKDAEDFVDKRHEYYHLIPVSSDEAVDLASNDSRLYRLLTTGSGLVPPR